MSEADAFDWSSQTAVVVRRVDAIAVYRNKEGDIVIRQERAMMEVDAVVTIPIQHAYSVIEALTRHVKGPFPAPPGLPPIT